jgi:hypothetical protein
MDTPQTSHDAQAAPIPPTRNLREVIRFPSDEECEEALRVLMELHERHTFHSYNDPNEWWLYTDTVRKLRTHGVQFQWLTENV